MEEKLVKVLFELDSSDWHSTSVESVWAERVSEQSDAVFAVRNTPFYAKGVSFLDVVKVQESKEHEGIYYFAGIIERSGHSTYRILVSPHSSKFEKYWKQLEHLGCSYESGTEKMSDGKKILYAIDVPTETDVYEVYDILEEGEEKDVWVFEEGHVGHPLKNAQ